MALPQYITGATHPRKLKIATAQAVAKGDLCALSTDTVIPLAAGSATGTLAQIQAPAAAAFVGVSMDEKTSTQARPFGYSEDNLIMVATSGVYEFDCGSATFAYGAFVGCDTTAGPLPASTKVIGVASDSLSIGTVAESYPAATTRVKVYIRPAVGTYSK